MDRARAEPTHRAVVDAWLADASAQTSSIELCRTFHAGLERIWSRAITTLGSVTLTAIAERVLYDTIERYAFLSVIAPLPSGTGRARDAVYERLANIPRTELIEGLRFGVIELLTVIGALTAEILSHDLHDALTTATDSRSTADVQPITARKTT
jgi:hypothetical protein